MLQWTEPPTQDPHSLYFFLRKIVFLLIVTVENTEVSKEGSRNVPDYLFFSLISQWAERCREQPEVTQPEEAGSGSVSEGYGGVGPSPPLASLLTARNVEWTDGGHAATLGHEVTLDIGAAHSEATRQELLCNTFSTNARL